MRPARGLTTVRTRAQHVGMGLMEMAATSYLSLMDAMVGDVAQARKLSTEAIDNAERRGWSSEPQRLPAVAAAALVHLQCHELDAAQHLLDSALGTALPETDIGSRLILNIVAVGVATARRDLVEARIRLRQLDTERVDVGAPSDFLQRWIRVVHADVLLLAGRPDDALSAVSDPGGTTDFGSAMERVARSKAHLALGHPSDALTALGPAHRFDGYRVQSTQATIIESIAYLRLHRDVAAASRFADAVALAQPGGLIAPFITTGPDVAAQLTRHKHLTDKHTEFVDELITAIGSVPTRAPTSSAPPPELTERELAVLQYLPTLLRATDIADDLFVSVNTVKSHLRGIYSKLGASNRREAVQLARDHQLI